MPENKNMLLYFW